MAELPRRRLPTELLNNIITLYVVWHIDDLVAGPLALPFIPTSVDGTDTDIAVEVLRAEIRMIEAADPALDAHDPVMALLHASYQLRETTLKVLSDVFGIKVTERGRIRRLSEKPWDLVHPVRLQHSNSRIGDVDPVLKARADTAAARSRLLRSYSLFSTAHTFFFTTPALGLAISLNYEAFLTQLRTVIDVFVAAMVNTAALPDTMVDAIWQRAWVYDCNRIAFTVFKVMSPQIANTQHMLSLNYRVSKLQDAFEHSATHVEPLFETLHCLLRSIEEYIVDAEERLMGGFASVVQQSGVMLQKTDMDSTCAALDEMINFTEHAGHEEFVRCQRLAASIRSFLPDAPIVPGMLDVKVDPIMQQVVDNVDALEGAMALALADVPPGNVVLDG